LGCGSSSFAGRADEATATKIIDHAFDLGITYFDTAETYAEGRSEMLLGQALKSKRSDVVVATKFGKDRSVAEHEQRASRRRILKAVDGSLRRLQTDYIDLYVLHEPDPSTPIEETLRTLDDLVRAGKIRYIGCADFRAWQLSDALSASRLAGFETFIASGGEYNLLSRDANVDMIPCCRHHRVAFVPTAPLAQGFLTGKYRPNQPLPTGSRFSEPPAFSAGIRQDLHAYDRALTTTRFNGLHLLEDFAHARGHSVLELAIAWLLNQQGIAVVPVGVTRIEQVAIDIAGATWTLTEHEMNELGTLT
jgi:aryl-alcohol dehydrogenase-like predicted oxidoreductase